MKSQLKESEISFEVNGESLRGWLIYPVKRDLLIYYGGNAEELSYVAYEMKSYSQCASLMVNYRGYGDSSGGPSEEALFADALAIFDLMKEKYDRIILCGRSLGSGVACYVAGNREVTGCILITPYDSMKNTAQDTIPWLPMGIVCKHKFESVEHIQNTKTPGLFIVAGKDEIIGVERSEKLATAWQGEKIWKVYPQHGHNSYQVGQGYYDDIIEFLNTHFSQPKID